MSVYRSSSASLSSLGVLVRRDFKPPSPKVTAPPPRTINDIQNQVARCAPSQLAKSTEVTRKLNVIIYTFISSARRCMDGSMPHLLQIIRRRIPAQRRLCHPRKPAPLRPPLPHRHHGRITRRGSDAPHLRVVLRADRPRAPTDGNQVPRADH